MKTIAVAYPDETIVKLCPTPRKNLSALNQMILELTGTWVNQEFSTADVIMIDGMWSLMKSIIELLPRADKPGAFGCDLDLLDGDYIQLERLFFCQSMDVNSGQMIADFNLDQFKGGLILELHRFNGKKKLIQAEAHRQSRLENHSTMPSVPQTSHTKAQEMSTVTSSAT